MQTTSAMNTIDFCVPGTERSTSMFGSNVTARTSNRHCKYIANWLKCQVNPAEGYQWLSVIACEMLAEPSTSGYYGLVVGMAFGGDFA